LGTATVNAKFPQANRSYDCVVGTFQMCIMMLFNNASNSQMTVKQIKDLMKMDDDTCAKNLKTLMFKNYKLLEIRGVAAIEGGKMTPGMSNLQLRDESVIGINESFSSPLNRIVFPTPVIEEVYKKEIVQEDRSIAIEAAIVRIMKSRKKLDH
jgi:cullin 1